MSALLSLTAPVIMAVMCVYGASRGVDVYSALTDGARKGLRVMADILPALLVLFPMIQLLRASGLPELLEAWLSPWLNALGIPGDTVILMLLRPISGSAALSAAAEIMSLRGADSLTGRTAAVMLGSSETTFYVTAVYLAAAGIKDSRWAIPAAVLADLVCFLSSAWICRVLWG